MAGLVQLVVCSLGLNDLVVDLEDRNVLFLHRFILCKVEFLRFLGNLQGLIQVFPIEPVQQLLSHRTVPFLPELVEFQQHGILLDHFRHGLLVHLIGPGEIVQILFDKGQLLLRLLVISGMEAPGKGG